MEKKLMSVVVTLLAVIGMMPVAFSETPTVGSGMGIVVPTENFKPRVFMYPDRFITHNNADGGEQLYERVQNYAFEGEQIHWMVIVWDKNGDDKLLDVSVNLQADGQDPGMGDIEANCDQMSDEAFTNWDDMIDMYEFFEQVDWPEDVYGEFNVRELEEYPEWNPETMNLYLCTLTVEPYDMGDGMYGEYYVYVEAEDLDGLFGTFDENEYWFFNPVIALEVVGDGIIFGDEDNPVRPGSNAYSDTLLIRNAADYGSGVLLDMAISGTDFYDPASSGAKCPDSNILRLRNLAYYATNGNYETGNAPWRVPVAGGDEGYFSIPYETGNEDDRAPIIENDGIILLGGVPYQAGNVLSPGAEIAITFRLALPEPCNGDFSQGQIYFWGEAI